MLDIIIRENCNSIQQVLSACSCIVYTRYFIYTVPYLFVWHSLCYGPLFMGETEANWEQGQASSSLGHCLWTYTMKLWLTGRVCYFSIPASLCSFPEKKAKKNKMCWYQIFLKEKQLPKSAQRSIRIFIPIFSPCRPTDSKMKTGAPEAGSSTRKRWWSQALCGILWRSRE